MNNKITAIIVSVVVVIIFAGVGYFIWSSHVPGKLDDFAKCIKSSGATFYGAFWCPHCQAQKALFGSSVQYLPYHECSTADGTGELQECKDKGVTGYPTWVFADASRIEGEATLQDLTGKTGCAQPQ